MKTMKMRFYQEIELDMIKRKQLEMVNVVCMKPSFGNSKKIFKKIKKKVIPPKSPLSPVVYMILFNYKIFSQSASLTQYVVLFACPPVRLSVCPPVCLFQLASESS